MKRISVFACIILFGLTSCSTSGEILEDDSDLEEEVELAYAFLWSALRLQPPKNLDVISAKTVQEGLGGKYKYEFIDLFEKLSKGELAVKFPNYQWGSVRGELDIVNNKVALLGPDKSIESLIIRIDGKWYLLLADTRSGKVELKPQ